jgi:hypothetical protein
MTETELIREIAATYQKHGWTLRRVLLTRETLEKTGASFKTDAPVFVSGINALWFSRVSAAGEAWELRALSAASFALFELLGKEVSEEERSRILLETEKRLKERAKK